MKHLLLLNDPPYGTERSFNGLRMAHAMVTTTEFARAAKVRFVRKLPHIRSARAPVRLSPHRPFVYGVALSPTEQARRSVQGRRTIRPW